MNLAPMAIAVVALAATLTRLVSALEDVRALAVATRMGIVSRPGAARRIARAGVRRELWRIVKHALTIGIIAMSYAVGPPPADGAWFVNTRNWLVAMISLALMVNSLLDYVVQRRAIAEYLPDGIDRLDACPTRRTK